MNPLAAVKHLYVHVPFCAHRCGYCDFVTTSAQPEIHERYVAALMNEIDAYAAQVAAVPRLDVTFDTIFIGGGTPTLLEKKALDSLLSKLNDYRAEECEVTIECNPETVDEKLAQLLAASCVNRVSLGAQSFSSHVLTTLERRAAPETVVNAFQLLRSAGIENISLDLIWGVPGQSTADVKHDLQQALTLEPNHISAYELEFKPGTRISHAYPNVGRVLESAGDELDTADHYDTVIDLLTAAGYEWYELANFAREGRRSLHNLAYWKKHDYLGVGVGAVSTIAGSRTTRHANLVRYLAAIEQGKPAPSVVEVIDSETDKHERLMLALRLADPVPTHVFSDAEVDSESITLMLNSNLLERVNHSGAGGGSMRSTRKGRMLLNAVLAELLGD